jgi:DNA-binding response OmpR family regulator
MPQQILIIEDEVALVESLSYQLEREGYEVLTAVDGRAGLDMALAQTPDLIILDLMLPGMSGMDVCRAVRRQIQVPILMLTAKAEEADKVAGLELGADDYVTKPFGMSELVARVRALLRRARPEPGEDAVLRGGDIELDLSRHEAKVHGEPVHLAPKEFLLLATLMRRPGHVFSREALLTQVWGDAEWRDPHTVDVHVRWLRQKIEPNPQRPQRIVTVRGFGYKFFVGRLGTSLRGEG